MPNDTVYYYEDASSKSHLFKSKTYLVSPSEELSLCKFASLLLCIHATNQNHSHSNILPDLQFWRANYWLAHRFCVGKLRSRQANGGQLFTSISNQS